MDDEKLISLVKEREFLFNKFHPYYKNPEMKKTGWREIGMAMGYEYVFCMKRWKSLRDRYGREKRMVVTPSGSAASCNPQWHLYSAMDFLAAYVTPRPMRSSTNILEMSQSPTQSSSDLPLPSPKLFVFDDDIIITSDSTNLDFPSSLNKLPPTATKKRMRNIDVGEVDILFGEAMEAFKKICEKNESNNSLPVSEALQCFGQMILTTIAHMSPAKQVKAMQNVTALVMEIRLEPEE